MLLNLHAAELRATCVWLWLWRGFIGLAVVSMLVVIGGLHYTKPSGGVSSACRPLV